MSLNLGTIYVQLEAATAEFKTAMDDASKTVKGFTDGLKPIAAASAAAFAGLAGGIMLSLREANNAIQSEVKLASAVRATGAAMDIETIKQYAKSLQDVTIYGDDATVSAAALMTSMGMNQEQVMSLLPLTQDLAAAFGMDLQSAAMLVGKAVEGNAGALARYGIKLSDSEKKVFDMGNEATRAQLIMDKLTNSVGGMAQALADTPMGRYIQMMGQAGEVMESVGMIVGDILKPVFESLRDTFKSVSEWIDQLTPEAKAFGGEALLVATAVTGVATALLGVAIALPTIITGVGTLTGLFGGLGAAMAGAILPALPWILGIAIGIAGVILIIGLLRTAWDTNFGHFKDIIKWHIQAWKDFCGAIEKMWDMFVNFNKEVLSTLGVVFEKTGADKAASAAGGALASGAGAIAGGASAAAGFTADSFMKGLNMITDPLKDALGGLIPDIFKTGDALYDFSGANTDAGAITVDTGDKLKGMGQNAEAAGKALLEKFGTWDAKDVWGDQSAVPTGADIAPEAFKNFEETYSKGLEEIGRSNAARRKAVEDRYLQDLDQQLSQIGVGEQIAQAARNFGHSLMSAAGPVGSIIQSAVQGFQSAGPWGAIAAVAAQLMTRTKAFKETVAWLSDALGEVVKAFEPLAESGKGLVMVIMEVVMIILDVLTPVFTLLSLVNQGLFYVIKYVAMGLAYVVKGIGDAWNWMMSTVQSILEKIPGVNADWMDSLMFDMTAVNRYITELQNINGAAIADMGKESEKAADTMADVAGGLGGLSDATDKATESTRELSESLTNVPEGFKVALARFNATEGEPYPGTSGTGGKPGQIQGAPSWFAGSVINVFANDPKKFKDEMEKEAAWRAYRRTGSPIVGAPAYAGAK